MTHRITYQVRGLFSATFTTEIYMPFLHAIPPFSTEGYHYTRTHKSRRHMEDWRSQECDSEKSLV